MTCCHGRFKAWKKDTTHIDIESACRDMDALALSLTTGF
jgi:hypothetical protein